MTEGAGLPVAERWWRTHDAGDGVTLLVETHITPMLESNVWHVRGRDADLVVDTANGIGKPEASQPPSRQSPSGAIGKTPPRTAAYSVPS